MGTLDVFMALLYVVGLPLCVMVDYVRLNDLNK